MGARGADGGTRYLLSCAVRWRGVSVTCVAPPAVSSGDRLTRHLPRFHRVQDKGLSPVGHLLEPAQRQKVASELNAAILASQSETTTPRLPNLLKLLVWSQQQLSTHCEFPVIDPLA